jgi:hypothetical protein
LESSYLHRDPDLFYQFLILRREPSTRIQGRSLALFAAFANF